ncbi:MAG TPA: VOC family protein [Candidatus Binatia bacterium]|nr:VOC family protein [Candidatus Binatia bacterium]
MPVRVDHFSIAVRSIDRALEFFSRMLPVRVRRAARPGYTDDFRWCDFYVGHVKMELIESARPGSFVEKFLERRGEGIHHLSIDVDELDPLLERMRRDGVRIVDEFDAGDGDKTAFISPRSAHGMLVQFWQVKDVVPPPAEEAPAIARLPGLDARMRFDHLSSAVRSIPETLGFLQRYLPIRRQGPEHRGYAGDFDLKQFDVGDVGRFRMELVADASGSSFVVRFLARRGEGFHHVSIDVDDLAPVVERLRSQGVRIVDEADIGAGYKTAFVSPRSAHGVLIQFWQVPDLHEAW